MSQLKQCSQSSVPHFKQNGKELKRLQGMQEEKFWRMWSCRKNLKQLVLFSSGQRRMTEPNNDMKYLAVKKKKEKKKTNRQ